MIDLSMPNIVRTTLVVLASNTLGPYSLPTHGFDWIYEPFDAARFVPVLNKIKLMEDSWGKRVRQWQKEGAIESDYIIITPGVIGWVVSIEATHLEGRTCESILGEVADIL